MKYLFPLLLIAAFAVPRAAERVVSTAGAITETIYALGAQGDLVAADVSERLSRRGDENFLRSAMRGSSPRKVFFP